MKKATKWIVLLLVLGGVGFGYYRHKASKTADSAPTYTKASAEIRTIRMTVQATGEIEPRNRLDVKPPIAGRLEELLVDEGDGVDKGQVLGWISSTERATLLDAALATSEEELEYWQQLYKPTPLISPLKGTIIARNFEPGQSISSGDAVVVIADDLIVVANLDETDIGLVKVGQKVLIRLDAYPDQEFAGVVEKIAYDATTISNVTMYQVDVRPDSIPDFARSGMTADVEFTVNEKSGVVAVPSAAVQQSFASGYPTTFVLLDSGNEANPTQLPVQIGLDDGAYTEIVGGIQADTSVLIPGVTFSEETEQLTNPFMPNMPRRGGPGGRAGGPPGGGAPGGGRR